MLGLTLRALPAEHAGRAALSTIWHTRVEALLPLQDPAGYWHTLVDDAEAYRESSATALFAAGIAAGLSAGLSHTGAQAAVERAMAALDASITVVDGRHQLPDISGATVPGSADSYREVETRANIAYGVGAYILAALESARMRGELAEPR
jgi:unsaturated rhamnogalacturonyl hydrolase